MKKISFIFLSALLLAACGQSQPTETPATETPDTTVDSSADTSTDSSMPEETTDSQENGDKITRGGDKAELDVLLDQRQTVTAKAIEKKDTSYCEDIEDANFVQECLYNVITSEDYPSDDPGACKEIQNEALSELCTNNPKWN